MDCKKILSYIFPPLCWWCDQEWVFLCKECCGEIISYEWTTSKYTESWHIDKILIWFSYSWPIKKIIKFIKYKSVLTYCDVLVNKLLLSWIINNFDNKSCITSIPMHWRKKYMIRGYNQAELLWKEVSAKTWIPYISLAKKQKWTKVQAKLSREKRKSNILWSFLLYWEIPEHIKKIIIVDDLITTWSTLFALAKEIKKTYPNITIIGLIFAKN